LSTPVTPPPGTGRGTLPQHLPFVSQLTEVPFEEFKQLEPPQLS
jgi:hypothetical protein